jgi:hypothetical protein
MGVVIDLTGKTFGRLYVQERASIKMPIHWRCQCACGRVVLVKGSLLRDGNTRSCGCLRRETTSARTLKHGQARYDSGGRTHEYSLWLNMRQRCSNPKAREWKHYGGRGITVCDRWQQSFEAFYEDMGPKPVDKRGRKRNLYSLDRINNDGPYCRENCKWSTQSEQVLNSSNARNVTFLGRTMSISQWEMAHELPNSMVRQRLNAGWSVERAILTPPFHSHGRHLNK